MAPYSGMLAVDLYSHSFVDWKGQTKERKVKKEVRSHKEKAFAIGKDAIVHRVAYRHDAAPVDGCRRG